MKVYNTVKYWNKRRDPNSKNLIQKDTEKHCAFVVNNISKESMILDFGPGVGRILPSYSKTNKIVGYDISSKYKEKLLLLAKELDLDFKFILSSEIIKNLPFEDKQFDKAVSISVFLHQLPTDIENIMCELARVSKKVIAVSWYDLGTKIDDVSSVIGKNHCFNYDYKELCKKNNLILFEYSYDKEAKQIYFVYGK